MRILIVDDEELARLRLLDMASSCAEHVGCSVVGEAATGNDALDKMESLRPDLVLVDVSMPGMTGPEFVERAKMHGLSPCVIFVTAHEEFAAKAFDLNAVDYLVKPVRKERFEEALLRAKQRIQTKNVGSSARANLTCRQRGKVHLVPVDEILFFKADCKYVTAKTRDREFLLEDTLLSLEREFGDKFVRLHRGVLAAKTAISGVERSRGDEESDWSAIICGGLDRLPISRRQWGFVKHLFSPKDF